MFTKGVSAISVLLLATSMPVAANDCVASIKPPSEMFKELTLTARIGTKLAKSSDHLKNWEARLSVPWRLFGSETSVQITIRKENYATTGSIGAVKLTPNDKHSIGIYAPWTMDAEAWVGQIPVGFWGIKSSMPDEAAAALKGGQGLRVKITRKNGEGTAASRTIEGLADIFSKGDALLGQVEADLARGACQPVARFY